MKRLFLPMVLYTAKLSSEMSYFKKMSFHFWHSTQQLALRAAVSPWCLPAPVWRTSGRLRSSSATALGAPATTLPINTASGWQPWIPIMSLPSRQTRRRWREARSASESAAAKCAARSCSRQRWKMEEWGGETSGGDSLTFQEFMMEDEMDLKKNTWLTEWTFLLCCDGFRIESSNIDPILRVFLIPCRNEWLIK